MRTFKRYGYSLIIFIVQILYFPVNRIISGGVLMKVNLDQVIHLQPEWIWFYMLCLPLWILAFIVAGIWMDDNLFWEMWQSTLIACSIGLFIFITYPTYVERPEITGHGISVDMLRYVYENDRVYNAFPSAHVYLSTIVTFFMVRWKPQLRAAGLFFVMLVILSTLFTKQHSVVDAAGGVLVACVGYGAGLVLKQGVNRQRKLAE